MCGEWRIYGTGNQLLIEEELKRTDGKSCIRWQDDISTRSLNVENQLVSPASQRKKARKLIKSSTKIVIDTVFRFGNGIKPRFLLATD